MTEGDISVEIRESNVKGTFLNPNLAVVLYIEELNRYVRNLGKILKVKKGLYKLK